MPRHHSVIIVCMCAPSLGHVTDAPSVGHVTKTYHVMTEKGQGLGLGLQSECRWMV